MPKANDFQKFYETSLKDQLLKIEAERILEFEKVKQGRVKGVVAGLILAMFIALGIMFMQPQPGITIFFQVFLVFGIFFGLSGLAVGNHYTIQGLDKIRLPFKKKIIAPIVEKLNPDLTYFPEKRITNEEVAASKLFQDNIDLYQGDDMIEGGIAGVKFHFSELHLHIKVKKSDHNGRNIFVNIPFFKGIFLVAEFPEPIIDCLIVRPNLSFQESKNNKADDRIAAEKKTRKNNDKYFSWSADKVNVAGELERLKTEDHLFNEQFDAYSTNKDLGEKLLNLKLKQQLKAIKEKDYNRAYFDWLNANSRGDFHLPAPYCSIVDNKVFLAKPFNRKFFNTDLQTSVANPTLMEMYYYDIKELLQLTEEVITNLKEHNKTQVH